MRLSLIALILGVAASAWSVTYTVPDQEEGIEEINQAMDLASVGDTVLVSRGVYDSVRYYTTPLGRRSAVVKMKDGVVLRGVDREDVKIDQTEAEYGIMCLNVGPDTAIENLTVRGGIKLRAPIPSDDGDGRYLIAGIACIDDASPTITDVTVEGVSTGIVVRAGQGESAPRLEGVEVARCDHHGIYVYGNGASPAVVDHATLVDNFDNGIYVFEGAIELSSCNITHNGKHGIKSYLSTVDVRYCNLYWNDASSQPPENYSGLEDLTGVDGNVSLEPYYCDLFGGGGYDYTVCFASDILTLGEGGTRIGAWAGGCTDCVSPVRQSSWGAIKAMFR